MNNEQKLIDFIESHGGKPPQGETWTTVGLLFGVAPSDTERASKDSEYRMEAIRKKAQDIWRRRKIAKPQIKKKRLFYDIETSYNILQFKAWSLYSDLNPKPSNIVKERAIICVSYKWEGEDKVHTLKWDDGCDKQLVKKFIDILNESDEIIGHNIDRFDTRWLKTRALYHGIEHYPVYKSTDTKKLAKRQYNFNSNSLDYIAQYLGVGKKVEHRGMSMWDDIIERNDPVAMTEMIDYCEMDVLVTENVYNKLMYNSLPTMNYAVLDGKGKDACPECGSISASLLKTHVTASGTLKRLMQCNDCGRKYYMNNAVYVKNYV